MPKNSKLNFYQEHGSTASLKENRLIRKLTAFFGRSPQQINSTLESDAELIRLENGKILAITLDNIVEEIATGLYDDPYLIGRMTVIVNMSDLAAVGAKPIGMVLSQQFPKNFPEDSLLEIQKGIADACKESGTFILGGDTNENIGLQSGGAAIGWIEDEKIITRKGCKAGDVLFASAHLGLGGAYAFEKLLQKQAKLIQFQPKPKLKEGELIRTLGSSCIDTSDGFFAALANIMELNQIGFQLTPPLRNTIHPDALRLAKHANLPPWFFLTGPHGDFELLFTIPEEKVPVFLKQSSLISWQPLRLGHTIKASKVVLPYEKNPVEIDVFKIANLFSASQDNPEIYLNQLLKLHQLWQLQ